MKIAYAGIDLLYPALRTLLQSGQEILKIFTCPCDNVTEYNTEIIGMARAHDIPYTVERVKKEDLAALAAQGCDLFLCAGYYYKVPVTDAFPMINVHPAPLPACRGGWPMPLILLGAYPAGGVTLHKMAAGFDTGDIIDCRTFPIGEEDTLADYSARCHRLLPDMITDLLASLPEKLKNAKPQGEGRYLAMPGEKDYTILPSMTVKEADAVLRAFFGYECYYLAGDGGKYELIEARAVKDREGSLPLADGSVHGKRVREL